MVDDCDGYGLQSRKRVDLCADLASYPIFWLDVFGQCVP